MRWLFLLGLFQIIFYQQFFAQSGQIKGRVFDRTKSEGLEGARIELIGADYITKTNSFGEFEIKNMPGGIYILRASSSNYGDTSVSNILITEGITTFLDFTLPPPCQYDKSMKSKQCPNCHKKKNVIPIVYEESASKKNRKKYYADECLESYCKPHWYCTRDKLKF